MLISLLAMSLLRPPTFLSNKHFFHRVSGIRCNLCPVQKSSMKRMLPLPHWGRDKMAVISQTLSNAFSWIKMYEFRLKFHWKLFLGVKLIISQHWFRQWLGAVRATSHYLNQWYMLFYWRIYASLGLNELKKGRETKLFHSLRAQPFTPGSRVGLCSSLDMKLTTWHRWPKERFRY